MSTLDPSSLNQGGEGGGYVAEASLKQQSRKRLYMWVGAISVIVVLAVGISLGVYFGTKSDDNDNPIVEFTVLHLNDLYELDGVQGMVQYCSLSLS